MEEIIINIYRGNIYHLNVCINCINKYCIIDDKKIAVNDKLIGDLLHIIFTFKEEYGSKVGIDLEEFFINIKSYDGNFSSHGKGVFPDYYYRLKEIIGDLNGK